VSSKTLTAPLWAESFTEEVKFIPLGRLVRLRNQKNDPIVETQVLSLTADRGVIRYEDKGAIGNNASEDISRYSIVRIGDIVINSMNVIIGSVGLSKYDGALSPVYYVLVPLENNIIDMRYLAYHFQIKSFQKSLIRIGYGILDHRMRIPWINMSAELIAVPDLAKQVLIADYLDSKIQIINQLIVKRKKQIELAEEVLSSKLSELFLNISEEDQRIRLRRLIADERLGIWGEDAGVDSVDVLVARVADFNRKIFKLNAVETLRSVELNQFLNRRVKKGDILLERSGGGEKSPVGCAVFVTEDIPNLVSSNFVSRIRAIGDVNPEYLSLVFIAMYVSGMQRPHSSQTTGIQNLDTESYFQVEIPDRELFHQEDLAKTGRQLLDKTAAVIDRLEKSIVTLQNFKDSLITFAVSQAFDGSKEGVIQSA
jgi:type I restriction enzyme S subunit